MMLRPENGIRLSAVYTHGYRLDEIDGTYLAADSAGSMKNGRVEIEEEAHPASRPGMLHAI